MRRAVQMARFWVNSTLVPGAVILLANATDREI